LGTVALLQGDVSDNPLVPVRGALAVRPVTVDEELLDQWAAPPQRQEWWRQRLAACHEVWSGERPRG
jgi:O-succinylbenzoate synthase